MGKEQPLWFTVESVKGYAQQGWLGDESSGIPVEVLEKKIETRSPQENSQKEIEVVDVSKLTDSEFALRLEQILLRQSRARPDY